MSSYNNISTPKSKKHKVQKISISLEPQVYGKPYNIVPEPSGWPSKNQDLYKSIPMPYSQPLWRVLAMDHSPWPTRRYTSLKYEFVHINLCINLFYTFCMYKFVWSNLYTLICLWENRSNTLVSEKWSAYITPSPTTHSFITKRVFANRTSPGYFCVPSYALTYR